MEEEIRQAKREAIVEAKKKFLEPTRLMDIHSTEMCFFEDVVLWGINPMRTMVDAIDNILWENPDADIIPLLNDLKIKLDDLSGHMERWDIERRAVDKKVVNL